MYRIFRKIHYNLMRFTLSISVFTPRQVSYFCLLHYDTNYRYHCYFMCVQMKAAWLKCGPNFQDWGTNLNSDSKSTPPQTCARILTNVKFRIAISSERSAVSTWRMRMTPNRQKKRIYLWTSCHTPLISDWTPTPCYETDLWRISGNVCSRWGTS